MSSCVFVCVAGCENDRREQCSQINREAGRAHTLLQPRIQSTARADVATEDVTALQPNERG